MAEERLDEAAAVAAVIRDNLFGLEIDPRCTQIAAFNLALAASRRRAAPGIPVAGGTFRERHGASRRWCGASSPRRTGGWLRNQFFEQHCKLLHNRPFIWHIWDGRKDGFAALVNYHRLDDKALENLTYAYLGDWITAQGKSNIAGADSRLGAAQELQAKLKLILAGEPPYDIFVRWKPLRAQPIGWHPDLNDGVRMNIRPFMEAGILRKNPNIKWTKDRGKEPTRDKADFPWFWKGNTFTGDRVNDVNLSSAEKQAARQ